MKLCQTIYSFNLPFLFLLLPVFTKCAPTSDLIDILPGYGKPPTKQYSGFLNATEGCDSDTNGICKLHYWFVEADEGEDDPVNLTNELKSKPASQKPVVLWLNGGPGSSSILGLLQENGPLLINSTGDGFMKNPWSWSSVANLLALEAPVGVGYSYCGAQKASSNQIICKNTDKYTASATRAALVDFFENKFPELADNDFFITGESYAGVYIPTLAKELLDDEKAARVVNLKGLAVGDPCTDSVAQADSMDSLWYGHKYGLVSDSEFDLLWNKCGARYPPFLGLGSVVGGIGSKEVIASLLRQRLELNEKEDLLLDRNLSSLKSKVGKIIHQEFFSVDGMPGLGFQLHNPECLMAHRKFLISTSHGLSQGWAERWLNDYSLFSAGGLTSEDDSMQQWMRRKDVRQALHVEDAPSDEWPTISQGFDYRSEYAACNSQYDKGTPSMVDFYREIAPKLEVTVVYNGDTDPCVSYEGTALAISRVNFEQLDSRGYRPWFYNHTAVDDVNIFVEKAALFGPDLLAVPTGPQFGGEIINYEHNLSFVTVHGSGHMVPQFRPQAALHMLTKVLERKDFSPPMPTNETLKNMSDDEFEIAIVEWTQMAKAAPYVPDL